MNKNRIIVMALFATLLLASCGNNKKEASTNDSTTSTEVSESTGTSTGSENWDDILNSYEEYIDQYIKLMEKAKSGDAAALSEYPAMMEKATALSEKLQGAGSSLSTDQMSKFLKLQEKLATAAAKM